MRCPRCQHENRGDANFCLECGRQLALSCDVVFHAIGSDLHMDSAAVGQTT